MKTPTVDLKILATTCLIVGAAAPLTEAADSPKASQRSSAIEEVLVTAQKRIENIQDVPKSVDVKTQEDFDKAAISSLNALSTSVPSITSTSQSSQNAAAPAIRGVKTITSSVGVQSKTGVLVDDIAQPTFSTLANELIDVERVEVFAGPQSTLSGRNAAGGLISITTRAPSTTPELDLGFVRTNDGQTRVTAFGSAPINDQFAFSLSGYKDHRDGDIYSPLEGKHIGASDKKGGRGKLQWQPSDVLTATLTGYYVESSQESPAVMGSGYNGWAYVAPGAPTAFVTGIFPLWDGKKFPRVTYGYEHGVSITRDRGINLHVDYDIDRLGTFSSLTNYQKSNQPSRIELFGQFQAFVAPGQDNAQHSDVATKYFSQEFRLVSEDMDPWTYLIGAIYSDSDLFEPYTRELFGPLDWDRTNRIKSAAMFARATYNFSDADSLTAGLRYQRDKSAYTWTFNTDPSNSGDYAGDSNYGFFGGELSFKHNFTHNVNAYVTLARAESGEAYDMEDSQSVVTSEGLKPLKSEVVNNIEIGLKSHLLDDRMVFNINAFVAKYDNYQIQTTDSSVSVPVIRTLAVGKVETKGVELSTSLQATEALRLDFNTAYIDATIKEYESALCYAGQNAASGCVNGLQDLSGADMPEAPHWKYTAAADYTLFLPSLPFDGNVGAFYRYQSEMHFDTLNDPNTTQDGFGVLNLYAGINTHDDRYRVQLFVNNVFDKHSYVGLTSDPILSAFGGGPIVYGSTDRNAFRYAGIRFDAKFK